MANNVIDQALGVLGAVAPTIATAFGGPLAGMAVKSVETAFGLDPKGDMQVAAAAIVNATPDQLLALKKADDDFKSHMADLGVELEKIRQEDRDSARKREADVKDRTPAALALLLTLGFFGVLSYMMTHGISKDTAGSEALLTMLGSLGTGFTMVLAYYFGSSAGSETKTSIIAAMSRKPVG